MWAYFDECIIGAGAGAGALGQQDAARNEAAAAMTRYFAIFMLYWLLVSRHQRGWHWMTLND